VVPNIKRAQMLSIAEILDQLAVLKRKAVENHLSQDELSQTTITLSNVGVIGGTYAGPLVNPPELAICALGRMRKTLEPSESGLQVCMHRSYSLAMMQRLNVVLVHDSSPKL
jgi:pyruvate/2-oxoglutarate dehydrogenase complex dihydrolipoamide acyltransferase (E2) component